MSVPVARVLRGAFAALATPPLPEAGPEFTQARGGATAMIVFFAAQELDQQAQGPAAEARWAALLADAARDGYPTLAGPPDRDSLARAVIALHAEIERRGDRAWDARLVAAYRADAERRLLLLPG